MNKKKDKVVYIKLDTWSMEIESSKHSKKFSTMGYLYANGIKRKYDMCVIDSIGNWANYTARLNYMNYLVACFETTKFDFSKLEC